MGATLSVTLVTLEKVRGLVELVLIAIVSRVLAPIVHRDSGELACLIQCIEEQIKQGSAPRVPEIRFNRILGNPLEDLQPSLLRRVTAALQRAVRGPEGDDKPSEP